MNTENNIIERYGEDLVKKLISHALIGDSVDKEEIIQMMYKNKIIKRTTKIIYVSTNSFYSRSENEQVVRINIQNGNNLKVLTIDISEQQAKEILKGHKEEMEIDCNETL